MQRMAINRTRVTLVNGDTVQRFTTTLRRPSPKSDRFYYWQGQEQVLRTVGAYNGRLLNGPYRLTDRTDRLLGGGTFKKGLKTGAWRQWRADGSLATTSYWRRGRQRGRTVAFDANSRPLPAIPAPKRVSAPTGAAGRQVRWWQAAYWKAKVKREQAAPTPPLPATPAATSPPSAPAAPTKKRRSKSSLLKQQTPPTPGA